MTTVSSTMNDDRIAEALAFYRSRINGRTMYEGREPKHDEILITYIGRLERALEMAKDTLEHIPYATHPHDDANEGLREIDKILKEEPSNGDEITKI